MSTYFPKPITVLLSYLYRALAPSCGILRIQRIIRLGRILHTPIQAFSYTRSCLSYYLQNHPLPRESFQQWQNGRSKRLQSMTLRWGGGGVGGAGTTHSAVMRKQNTSPAKCRRCITLPEAMGHVSHLQEYIKQRQSKTVSSRGTKKLLCV